MKILFVSFNAFLSGSSAAIRNYNLIKGILEDKQNEIDIITVNTNVSEIEHNKQMNVINIVHSKINVENRNHSKLRVKIVKFAKLLFNKFSFFDSTIMFLKNINLAMLSDCKYDLIISSSDPVSSHLAVYKLIRKGLKYDKWIQYWGDPYTIDITNQMIYPKVVLKEIERWILRGAEQIVYVSPFTLENEIKQFPEFAHKMRVLPIPYSYVENCEVYSNKKSVKIGYFGAYKSNIRNIIPLYEAVKTRGKSVELLIVGDSDLQLKEQTNIKIYDRVEKEILKRFESEVDAYICILNRTGTQIPGKIYHVAGTQKPIIILVDGNYGKKIKTYLESFQRYTFCNNEKDEIIKVLNYLQKEGNLLVQPCEMVKPSLIAEKMIHS